MLPEVRPWRKINTGGIRIGHDLNQIHDVLFQARNGEYGDLEKNAANHLHFDYFDQTVTGPQQYIDRFTELLIIKHLPPTP
jgi:hypothetical protein